MKRDVSDQGEDELAVELVRRIQGGDSAAEGELVRHYSRGLLYLLRRMTAHDLADDLHQETFKVVIERLRDSGLEDPSRLAGFLHRTARNLFIADYRKKVRHRDGNLEDAPPAMDPTRGQLSKVLLDEEAATVRRLVRELKPERDRQMLYRYYLLEDDKESICTDLGLSSLHFNRVLYRARKRFKTLLERSRKRQSSTAAPLRPLALQSGRNSGGIVGHDTTDLEQGDDRQGPPV